MINELEIFDIVTKLAESSKCLWRIEAEFFYITSPVSIGKMEDEIPCNINTLEIKLKRLSLIKQDLEKQIQHGFENLEKKFR